MRFKSFKRQEPALLKLTSHNILQYLWSEKLSYIFSQFLNMCGVTQHCLYRDSLTVKNEINKETVTQKLNIHVNNTFQNN